MLMNTGSFKSKSKVKVEIGFTKYSLLYRARVNFLGSALTEIIWPVSCFGSFSFLTCFTLVVLSRDCLSKNVVEKSSNMHTSPVTKC